MTYKPHPIDTSGIKLSEDILELTELLSKNTHEIWAQGRLAEDWRYGAQRDDARREHPGLIAYEELSEAEKQYDRNTTLETLKTILSLGYRIEPPATRSANRTTAATTGDAGDSDTLIESLTEINTLNLAGLLALWQTRDPARWAQSAEVYRRLAERLIKLGEMILAYDVVSEGRKFHGGEMRLRQLQALALSRLGATERANGLLRSLYDEGQRDEETLGLLARTHKDLWAQATDDAERAKQLGLSHRFYAEAYRLTGGYWTGINVATIALLSGDEAQARALAGEVRERCLPELKRLEASGGERYWPLATLGEAALVAQDWEEAARLYDEAAQIGRPGELTSTRRNARLIIEHLKGDPAFIDKHLPVPTVVVFTGQASPGTDGESSPQQQKRVPVELEGEVRRVIVERLKELNAGVGYSAVPSEADTLFLEAMLELGGEAHAVLPCQPTELFKSPTEADGGSRYKSIFARITGIVTASEQNMAEGGMSDAYSRLLLDGLALMRAQQLDTALVPLALSAARDSHAARRDTSSEHSGGRVKLIALDDIIKHPPAMREALALNTVDAPVSPPPPPQEEVEVPADFNAQLVALLFADAVNFSKLTEEQIPLFVRHFLGSIGALVARSAPAPLLKNTWGDGLYLVFENVEAAGRFALDLSDLLNATDWAQLNLPAELNLRIALHAGPVYRCTDPVTQALNFIGTHVSRAARLEPITPPGQVYASQAFAALATAQRAAGFTCDYVGQTPLAKKYGTFPTYHVRRFGKSNT